MGEEYIYTRNPWTDDDRSLGRIKDVLFLCEKTGHIDQVTPITLVIIHL